MGRQRLSTVKSDRHLAIEIKLSVVVELNCRFGNASEAAPTVACFDSCRDRMGNYTAVSLLALDFYFPQVRYSHVDSPGFAIQNLGLCREPIYRATQSGNI